MAPPAEAATVAALAADELRVQRLVKAAAWNVRATIELENVRGAYQVSGHQAPLLVATASHAFVALRLLCFSQPSRHSRSPVALPGVGLGYATAHCCRPRRLQHSRSQGFGFVSCVLDWARSLRC